MGKLATCSCHTALREKDLMNSSIQNMPGQLVMDTSCECIYSMPLFLQNLMHKTQVKKSDVQIVNSCEGLLCVEHYQCVNSASCITFVFTTWQSVMTEDMVSDKKDRRAHWVLNHQQVDTPPSLIIHSCLLHHWIFTLYTHAPAQSRPVEKQKHRRLMYSQFKFPVGDY